MEELLKIKEQELARLTQIKELLQQKLADETNRANVLQKELELVKAQTNTVPPQVLADLSKVGGEVGRLADKMAQIEIRLLKHDKAEKSPETLPSLEEKVDQILTSLTQFLTKVRVASKMVKPPAVEGQPPAAAETKEPTAGRPLKPSDLLHRQTGNEPATPAPEPSDSEAEKPSAIEGLAKPSEVAKRHQAEAEAAAETAMQQETGVQKGQKSKKSGPGAKTKISAEIPVETSKGDACEEEEEGEKKEKEAEAPGSGIITVPYPSDGSLICPRCGKQNYQEMQDPTNVVAYAPVKKFGRKFYCKSCRCNWRYKM